MDQIIASLLAQAQHHTEQAAHNMRESEKLQGMRARRVARLDAEAHRAYATRTTTSMTAEDIAYAWKGNDPKLNEYSAGMVITERRAAMHASMAADLRMQALCLMQQRQMYPTT